MMQVYGEALRRDSVPATQSSKRRRVALTDRTNVNETKPQGVPARKRAKKKVVKKTKRTAPTGDSQIVEDLPDGWVTDVSRTSGETYYRNTVTDEAQWEVPTEPAVRKPAVCVDEMLANQHVHKTLQHLGAAGLRVIECVQLPRSVSYSPILTEVCSSTVQTI